jgi:ABC-type nitrate/sulfonate/bicarbonate transport system substrate-binding protein
MTGDLMSRRFNHLLLIISLSPVFWLSGCKERTPAEPTEIRIGWREGLFPHTQLVQILKQTSIPEDHQLRLDIVGSPDIRGLVENAISGECDAVFVSPFAAFELLSRDPDWIVVSRFANRRAALYVPPESAFKRLADLDGETIGVASGSAVHAVLLAKIEEKGFRPGIDIRLRNVGTDDQIAIIERGNLKQWNRVAAVANDDPVLAVRESFGKARGILLEAIPSIVMVSRTFSDQHPEAVSDLLETLMDTHLYLAKHFDETVSWVPSDGMVFEPKTLKLCATAEPNVRAMMKGEVSLHLSNKDAALWNLLSSFLVERGVMEKEISVEYFIKNDFLRQAEASWWKESDAYPTD